MRSLLTLHLRQAVRGLRRNPTFTVAVLLTLALAIGANTAVFSVVNGVLINPMPYPEPESLVDVLMQAPGAPNAPDASGGITNMPESASSFESLGVFQPSPLNVAIADTSEQIRGVAISRGVLESLRVPPMLGRAEPLTYVAVALLLMTATVLASYIPARRISRVDPAVAMRAE